MFTKTIPKFVFSSGVVCVLFICIYAKANEGAYIGHKIHEPNGKRCIKSIYNCALSDVKGNGQRLVSSDESISWKVKSEFLKTSGLLVYDGNGDPIGKSSYNNFVLNKGQIRVINEQEMVFAISTGLGSAGWVPIHYFDDSAKIKLLIVPRNANGDALRAIECFEIGNGYDSRFDQYKLVKNSKSLDGEEPNDYLPFKRKSGRSLMNLAYNVPGFGIGGPAIDIFPSGTKFTRLEVPLLSNKNSRSIKAKLYEMDSGGNYIIEAGWMEFIYGYIRSVSGEYRYGWMPLTGLKPSTNCPARE